MQGLVSFIERRLAPPMVRVGSNRYLLAIRDGLIGTIPILVVGSLFLLLAFLPIPGWEQMLGPFKDKLMAAYGISFGILSLYLSVSLGYSLAKMHGLDPLSGSILSLLAFLTVVAPLENWMIPTGFLGGKGIFPAILAALFAVEIHRWLVGKRLTIKMPAGVPPAIMNTFESLTSVAVVLVIGWVLRTVIGVNVGQVILSLFKPLLIASDTLGAVAVEGTLEGLLWWLGLHAGALISWQGGILMPFALQNLEANAAAVAAGLPMPHIVTPSFQAHYHIGGTMLALVIIMLFFVKSAHLKQIGRVALIPAIFGIWEPMWFGAPFALNPVFFIPLVLTEVVTMGLTYVMMFYNLIGRTYVMSLWTIPAPLGAYLGAGDIRNTLWNLALILITFVIWYPFFVVYDRQLLAKEKEAAGQ